MVNQFLPEYSNMNLCPAGFGDVVEGEQTYKTTARILRETGAIILGWNDQEMTHHDILFTLSPEHKGNIFGGIKPESYLFVSIMRMGAFAFRLDRKGFLSAGYVDEKLGGLGKPCNRKIAELIMGVIKELKHDKE